MVCSSPKTRTDVNGGDERAHLSRSFSAAEPILRLYLSPADWQLGCRAVSWGMVLVEDHRVAIHCHEAWNRMGSCQHIRNFRCQSMFSCKQHNPDQHASLNQCGYFSSTTPPSCSPRSDTRRVKLWDSLTKTSPQPSQEGRDCSCSACLGVHAARTGP